MERITTTGSWGFRWKISGCHNETGQLKPSPDHPDAVSNTKFTLMKISLITGIIYERDAISAATMAKAKALKEIYRSEGVPLDLCIFVFRSDYDLDGRVKTVRGVTDIVLDEHFLSSDLIIYEFGFHNELFDSIHFAPQEATKIVHFHNITPAEFMPEGEWDLIRLSLEQQVNMLQADVVLTGSRFNHETLIEYGMDESAIDYISYVVDWDDLSLPAPAPKELSGRPDIIEALYVGRFTRSKGLLDLIHALHLAAGKGADNIHLTLIGNLTLSREGYLTEMNSLIEEYGLTDRVTFLGSASDDELSESYQRSQLFLTASYHEGFCIPVIEALLHECYVIAYNAGNLPYVVNGLGNIVPTGDVEALADAIVEYALAKNTDADAEDIILKTDSGPMSEALFKEKALEYARDFSYERFKERLAEVLQRSSLLPEH